MRKNNVLITLRYLFLACIAFTFYSCSVPDSNPNWQNDMFGDDEPPALFRGMHIGQSVESIRKTPGTSNWEMEGNTFLGDLDEVKSISGIAAAMIKDEKLNGIILDFDGRSQVIVSLYLAAVKRYEKRFGEKTFHLEFSDYWKGKIGENAVSIGIKSDLDKDPDHFSITIMQI